MEGDLEVLQEAHQEVLGDPVEAHGAQEGAHQVISSGFGAAMKTKQLSMEL